MSMEVDISTPEVMQTFYQRLYPYKSIFTWLSQSHQPTKLFTHREFAFTLPGDVYVRYQSFMTPEELLKQLNALIPTRFEIGPVYSGRPREKRSIRTGNFYPLQRELVFDIDMTDYDSIRTCCLSADICDRCWGFVAAAVHVLHSALTEQFGWKRILWVYSGRRGIHAWVSDREAMDLTDEQRRAVVGFLGIMIGSKDASKKLSVRSGPSKSLPPSLQAALDHLAAIFSDLILEDQDCFLSTEGWEALLEMVPNSNIVSTLRDEWSRNPSIPSSQKWSELKAAIRKTDKTSTARTQLVQALEDIILAYTYPRIDAEVSKHRNHLLKAPFCVHPKTGRICVPVDPDKVSEFKVGDVPTVGRLMKELNDAAAAGEKSEQGWESTSLRPYVEMLNRHVQGIMDDVRQENKSKGDMTW